MNNQNNHRHDLEIGVWRTPQTSAENRGEHQNVATIIDVLGNIMSLSVQLSNLVKLHIGGLERNESDAAAASDNGRVDVNLVVIPTSVTCQWRLFEILKLAPLRCTLWCCTRSDQCMSRRVYLGQSSYKV